MDAAFLPILSAKHRGYKRGPASGIACSRDSTVTCATGMPGQAVGRRQARQVVGEFVKRAASAARPCST
jgi:hypothetical protein